MNTIVMIGSVPPPYTGQSVSFDKLYKSLLEDSYNVKLINTAPKAEHIVGKTSYRRIVETLSALKEFFRVIKEIKPLTIYITKGSTTFGFLRDFFIVLISKSMSSKSRIVVHLKGGNYDSFYASQNFIIKKMIGYVLHKVDNIIVLGKSLVKMYDFDIELREKIVVIENALTSKRDDFISLDNKLKGRVELLFLSNLIYTKGYGDVLEAIEILIKKGIDNFHITFAGEFMQSPDDPVHLDMKQYQENFLNKISSTDLSKYISYNGVAVGDKKLEILKKANIFILPTQYHVEGQPVSIIEAMAYGCAIVTTKYRSIPDIIVEDKNGFYVEYNNPISIAEKLEELILDKKKLEDASLFSTNLYLNTFQWKNHYKKIKNILIDGKL